MSDGAGGAAPVRVVLVDDHRLFRESLRALLDLHGEVAVIAEGATGLEAVRLARAHQPDVVLLDVEMPGQSVMTTLADLRAASPGTRVIILTMHENTALARKLLLQGASAYLVKTIGHRELADAISACMNRDPDVITLSVTRRSLAALGHEPADAADDGEG